MRKVIFCMLFFKLTIASATEATFIRYDDHGMYVAITVLDEAQRILIDLRRMGDDRLLYSETRYSRLPCGVVEVKDITGDGCDEIFVKVKGGGTGVCTESLEILTVNFDSQILVESFSCVVNEYVISMSDMAVIFPDGSRDIMSSKHIERTGQVSFCTAGTLQYVFSEARRDGVELSLSQKVEMFRFNSQTHHFESDAR